MTWLIIGIILFFLLPAIFLNELKMIRDWLGQKIMCQKLENYIEPEEKSMENKKYTFGAQVGMGIKWLLFGLSIAMVLTVFTEIVKMIMK